ncbi:MAG: hypothetical protein M3Q40_05165 [Pseudomonadota bacterium]|nr:hypothetical protein [Pseudomonadota bacterium]
MNTRERPAWPGWSAQKTLLLPVLAEHWPPPSRPVEIDGIRFAPKPELHITLLGGRLGRELHTGVGTRQKSRSLQHAFEAHAWRFRRTGKLLRLEKHEFAEQGIGRRAGSIIELVDLPALGAFYRCIEELLGRQLPVPPAHVTLYTFGRPQGVGVPDPGTLRRSTVRDVETGELEELLAEH